MTACIDYRDAVDAVSVRAGLEDADPTSGERGPAPFGELFLHWSLLVGDGGGGVAPGRYAAEHDAS